MAKILVVDDAADNTDFLAHHLRKAGYEVVSADNGQKALDVAQAERPNVILLDVMLPGMSGIDVLLQGKWISPRTVRILLTAHCNDQDVVIPAINEGEVFRLLSKPWDDDGIRRVIIEALGMDPKQWRQTQQRVHERLRGAP